MFYSRCAFNAAANIDSIRRYSCYRLADILLGQAAGENEESRQGTGCSRSQPITRQASSTAEVPKVCVNEHVAIAKRRDLFGSEVRIRRERSDYAKFASQLATCVG